MSRTARRTIGTVIRQRRMTMRLTLEALAELARCAKSYLSAIENGRRDAPPGTGVLERIERALEMNPGTLVEMAAWERTPGTVRERIVELEARDRVSRRLVDLMSRFAGSAAAGAIGKSLDAAYRSGDLRRLVETISPESGEKDQESGAVRVVLPRQVPLINSVAAGYPTEFTDLGYPARVADEYVRAPDLADPDAFAARVVGDSMLPEYREGDIVIFSPALGVKAGMDCFVRLERDGEATFKRVFFQRRRDSAADDADASAGEWIRLHALNSRYPARVVHREEVGGIYPAVSVTRSLLL